MRGLRAEQSYQLVCGLLDGVVDDRRIELRLGRELLLRVLEPVAHGLLVVRAPTGETSLELLPAGRGEEDQPGVGHRGPNLPRPLKVDLQQGGVPGRDAAAHRLTGRAVEVAGELGPLQELADLDEALE